jgi:3',5'-cyclic AMP phosphodiesterase CpdA
MFVLAHLSDPHLAPLPAASWRELSSKRILGYLSWHTNRRHVYSRTVLDALTADVKALAPDHVAITGDLVNISLPGEFSQAGQWLKSFGPPHWISVIPGNHDAYIPLAARHGFDHWRDYMTGSTKAHRLVGLPSDGFPYVRLFGKIAVIGTTTAVPTGPWIARGRLGGKQRRALENTLRALGKEGCYRIVLIHHPPLPGQNKWRKALGDAAELRPMLEDAGAELILHGHNHVIMHQRFETRTGPAHVLGVPAAAAAHAGHKPQAHYNLYRIGQTGERWICSVTERAWRPADARFETSRTFELD